VTSVSFHFPLNKQQPCYEENALQKATDKGKLIAWESAVQYRIGRHSDRKKGDTEGEVSQNIENERQKI
jgi:hypothetical protein